MTRKPQQTQESLGRPMMSGSGGTDWFGAAVARTPIGLALIDREARVHHANLAFQRIFTTDGDVDAAAFSVYDCVDARDRERVAELVAETIAGTATIGPLEVRLASDDQRIAWIFVDVVQGGGAAELVMSTIDVSSVRRLDRQQFVAEKLQAVRQLAAGVAHNLNNRLTSMIGNADLLLEGCDDRDPAREDVLEIRREADQAAALVRELSAMADQRQLVIEPIDLNMVVREFQPLLERVMGYDIDTVIEYHPGALEVRADRQQLEQVLIDLAASARDRMKEGGTFTIRTCDTRSAELDHAPVPAYRSVEVTDIGETLTDRQLERMFEPFYSSSGPFAGADLSITN